MERPRGVAVLDIYEQGLAAGPAARAALLCDAAGDGPAAGELTLGEVDRRIWAVQRRMFEALDEAITPCDACGTELAFTLPPEFDLPPATGEEAVAVEFQGSAYRVRMPRLGDVAGGGIDLASLAPGAPWDRPDFVARAEEALEAADPALRVQIALVCHACERRQSKTLDVAGFLWASIEHAAWRLIRDTARLAAAFGWSEAEILRMSARRRGLYLAELGR